MTTFNTPLMVELSKEEMRQTDGGWGWVLVAVVVGIFLVGVHDGANAP